MVESLRRVGFWLEEKEIDQGVRDSGRSYVEVVKGSELRDTTRVRVETKEEEIRNNVSRLKQCLIGKWNPKSAREEDLARLGWSVARAWGLKGKLGLARLGKGCALLEFETVEEAKRVLASGVRSVGGTQLGLEMWSPRFGCSAEGEDRKEAWVRILGLPISLWVPSILRRVGEECSGFLGIDPLTEGGLGMGKDPGKAEWRGLAEFDGDQGGGGGICHVFVVGDSADNKEKTGGWPRWLWATERGGQGW